MNQQDEQKHPETESIKRPYSTPKLVMHGTVSKLVQNGTGSGTDGGPVGMNMVCL
jgi:hypothetical protein